MQPVLIAFGAEMDDINEEQGRYSQVLTRFDWSYYERTCNRNLRTPVEPDVHWCVPRRRIPEDSVDNFVAPDGCHRTLDSLVKYHENIGNLDRVRKLSSEYNIDLYLVQPPTYAGIKFRKDRFELGKRKSNCLTTWLMGHPNKKEGDSHFETNTLQDKKICFVRIQVSYFSNLRKEKYCNGQAAFTQSYVGNEKVDFCAIEESWMVFREKSIYFTVKVSRRPLPVIWQRQFIIRNSNDADYIINSMFVGISD